MIHKISFSSTTWSPESVSSWPQDTSPLASVQMQITCFLPGCANFIHNYSLFAPRVEILSCFVTFRSVPLEVWLSAVSSNHATVRVSSQVKQIITVPSKLSLIQFVLGHRQEVPGPFARL